MFYILGLLRFLIGSNLTFGSAAPRIVIQCARPIARLKREALYVYFVFLREAAGIHRAHTADRAVDSHIYSHIAVSAVKRKF